MNDFSLMGRALTLAEEALKEGEFPVGCVIGLHNDIVAQSRRKGSTGKFPSEILHAEILAIRELEEKIPPEKRRAYTLYSTMEPCLMCYAAILIAGIGRIVWAYEDVMGGGTSVIPPSPLYVDRKPEILPRFRREESLALFRRYFEDPGTAYRKESLLARHTLETS